MTNVRVEILEETLKDTIAGNAITLHRGDKISVDKDIASYWCGQGWARDTSGKIKTASRSPGAAPEVVPDKIKQALRG